MGKNDQGIGDGKKRYQLVPRTLCFVTHGDDVLLLRGAPGKRLWAGLYNGVGGHVEKGEDIYSATLREVKEETGLDIYDLRLRLVVTIDAGESDLGVLVFVFTAATQSRQAAASAEGIPTWFPKSALPRTEMVDDLPVILPLVLGKSTNDPPSFAAYSYDNSDKLQIAFAETE